MGQCSNPLGIDKKTIFGKVSSSEFNPAWWATNRHIQTIWGAVFRPLPKIPSANRIRLELADGDFIDVDLFAKPKAKTVLLLHGLEGSIDSHYMRGIVHQLIDSEFQVAVMHFRSCSGEINRLLKSYHSGISDDLQSVLMLLLQRELSIDYMIGFSLGGNVLLKWLGENHNYQHIKGAVAVSVPLLLDECATAIDRGFSKNYSRRLLATLREKTIEKKKRFPERIELTLEEINSLDNFWDFDHLVTAPLNGFDGATDYYRRCSSQQFLSNIQVPTLILHAKDDPFMSPAVIPDSEQLSRFVAFELSDKGGHVGFVEGRWPWSAEYFCERRIASFIHECESTDRDY